MYQHNYKNVSIIDGDFIFYIALNQKKCYDPSGNIIRNEKGNYIYEEKTFKEVVETFESYMNDLLHLCRADSFIFCITSDKNFRKEIDSSYKANRTGLERPKWFNEIREYSKQKWNAFEVENLEADDLVMILHNNIPNSFVIAVDKDLLKGCKGKFFDARKNQGVFVENTQDQADFAFAKSILTGDAIDGIPNVKKGYGPKTAEKELLASTDLDLKETVLKIYQREYGEVEGLFRFMTQIKLLKIIENFDELPKGISFEIPEVNCFNCIEEIFSRKEFKLNIKDA